MGSEQGRSDRKVGTLAEEAAVILDPRLIEVWQLVWEGDAESPEPRACVPIAMLAGLLRVAYLQGYSDATTEPLPGELYEQLRVRAIRPRPRGRRRRPEPDPPGSSGT